MTITPIVFILIIPLFGFDLTGHLGIPRRTTITANVRTRDIRVLKSQRRIDFNYVDELVVNEFFEPGPGPSNPEFS